MSVESHDSPDSVKLQSRKCLRGDRVADCYFALGNEDVLGPLTVIELVAYTLQTFGSVQMKYSFSITVNGLKWDLLHEDMTSVICSSFSYAKSEFFIFIFQS